MRVKIYYHHTDCGGVVYYGRYLEFLEEARTEFLEQRDILIKELIKQGVVFAISHQEIDYKSPAFYGDIIQIDTQLRKTSGVRLEFEYEIKNQSGKLIATANTVMACMSCAFKPKPIPEEVRKKLLK